MDVEKSTVQKLRITKVNSLDPITAYIENFSEGNGKITIECFGDCWSYHWGCMGQGYNLERFFLSAHNQYLIKKLSPRLEENITDYENLGDVLKSQLLKLRRNDDVDEFKARELWEDIEIYCENSEHWLHTSKGYDLATLIIGEEFWCNLPTITNHKYQYINKIIDAVKSAIREQK